MGKKKSVSLERVEVDGIIVTGQHLANHANDYFVTAAASLVSGIVLPLTHIFFTPPELASCFLYPATWVEVQIIIKGLKNKGNKVLDISTQIMTFCFLAILLFYTTSQLTIKNILIL